MAFFFFFIYQAIYGSVRHVMLRTESEKVDLPRYHEWRAGRKYGWDDWWKSERDAYPWSDQ